MRGSLKEAKTHIRIPKPWALITSQSVMFSKISLHGAIIRTVIKFQIRALLRAKITFITIWQWIKPQPIKKCLRVLCPLAKFNIIKQKLLLIEALTQAVWRTMTSDRSSWTISSWTNDNQAAHLKPPNQEQKEALISQYQTRSHNLTLQKLWSIWKDTHLTRLRSTRWRVPQP